MARLLAVAASLVVVACAHEGAGRSAPPAAGGPAAGRRVIQSTQAPKAIGPYSQAIEAPAGRLLFLAGQIPLDPASGQMVEGDTAVQAERVMRNLKTVLEAAGAGFDRVAKTTIYLTDLADFGKVNEVYGRYFGEAPPARATVQVAALPRGSRVEIEAVAVLDAAGAVPGRKVVSSPQAPRAIGPYSQAIDVTARRLVYLAGQIPLDPVSGEMVPGDTVAQAERVMQNLKAVLEAAGTGFDKVVKTTIYLTDLADFGKVNELYARYFGEAPPARATVQVAALPRGSRIEIDAIAATDAPAGAPTRAALSSAQAPKAIGPYSQAIETRASRLVFCAGQIPLDPATGEMGAGDTAAQAERVMQNLKAVLEAAGVGFDKVVKTTIFLVDLADFGKVNEVYGRYFGQAPPARATVQVKALPRGSRVEIEVLAAK
jgi:2-iminobutanoate/2-iminopropanoate deaminase